MAALCIVSGTLARISGGAIAGAVVAFAPAQTPVFVDGRALSAEERVELTDENGQFSVSLVQGLDVIIRIDEINLHRQVTIPETATVTLEELLDGDL